MDDLNCKSKQGNPIGAAAIPLRFFLRNPTFIRRKLPVVTRF